MLTTITPRRPTGRPADLRSDDGIVRTPLPWICLIPLLCALAAGAEEGPSGAEVVERALAALGGREALAQVETTYARGSLELPEVTGSYEQWGRRPNRFKVLVDLGVLRIERAFDGEEAWEKRGPSRTPLEGPDRERILRGALFQPLEAFREMKAPMDVVGREPIDGRDAWAIEIRPPAGTPERWFIDAESFLPLREVRTVPTSQGEATRTATYDDYREVAGILLPFTVTVETAGAVQVVRIEEVRLNEPQPEDLYRQPTRRASTSRFGMPAAQYEIRVERDVMVPMRDGVRLATDLYFPVGAPEKLPVVLIRLPYNKARYPGATMPAEFFAEQGYAVAVQDVRGKFASEGEFVVSAADRHDGYDMISWLVAQPWSTGKVGTYGCSYLGENQMLLAAMRHPRHVAMIPQAAGGAIGTANDRYGYFGTFEGGAFTLSAGFGWFRGAGSKVKDAPPAPAVDVAAALKTLPLVDMHARFGGPPSDWEGFVSHEPADPWWDRFGYVSDRDRFHTPALHVNSWYDYGAAETLYFFNLMQRNAESETARDNQFVVISPMTHCLSEVATERTTVGDLEVGDARFPYWDLYLRWFDYWLKGKDDGITDMPKVRLFVTGRNEWRAADAWPLPEARSTAYYLHSGGGANTRHGDGRLSAQEPAPDELPDRFTYDPANPVPSRGGSVCCTGNPEDQPGAFDQSDIEERPDVLVYTSDPLKEGLEVIGPLKVVLYVTSSAKDTDFTAKLLDVHPGGPAYNLQEGILRARYREGYDKSLRLEPGEVVRLEIDLHATAHYFAPGHRIRLEVASSNFPRFDRNLNTGGNNYDETEWVVAKNTVHHSPEHPSHVVLPIIP